MTRDKAAVPSYKYTEAVPKYKDKEYAIIVLAGGTASTLDALSSHTVHFDKAYGYQRGHSD